MQNMQLQQVYHITFISYNNNNKKYYYKQ